MALCAILRFMNLQVSAYIPGSSPVHVCDARVKIVMLVGYTATLFCAQTWLGQLLLAAVFCFALMLSRVPVCRVLGMGVPVYVLAAATVMFASINAQVGFELGCFYAVRMILLVLASLVVVCTTTSTKLTGALCWFMRPLRLVRVPVDDIAMVFSLALRFIPLTAQELCLVHDAQYSRGAPFSSGGLFRRLAAWSSVFIPLFVNLFRRADKLSVAMDARCYGAPGSVRSSLECTRMGTGSAVALFAGLLFLALVAAFL